MDKSDFREQRMRIILYRKGSPTNKCIAKNSAGIYKDRADVMQPRCFYFAISAGFERCFYGLQIFFPTRITSAQHPHSDCIYVYNRVCYN